MNNAKNVSSVSVWESKQYVKKGESAGLRLRFDFFSAAGKQSSQNLSPTGADPSLLRHASRRRVGEFPLYQGATGVADIVEFPHLLATNANPASQTDPNCSIKLLLMLQ